MIRVYCEKTLKLKLDCSVFFVTINQIKNNTFNFDNPKIISEIKNKFDKKRFDCEFGSILPFYLGCPVFVVGLGDENKINYTKLRIAVKHFLENPLILGISSIEIIPHDDTLKNAVAYAEGCLIGNYRWDKYLTNNKEIAKTIKIVSRFENAVSNTTRICEGLTLTRDLVNENADIINSDFIERKVRELCKEHSNVTLSILNETQMKKIGMNLFLAVNKGSQYEPKLIIVEYSGGKKDAPYTAILGKGITFDSGGLNLKPTKYIEDMRSDMAGTGAVIGTLKNILKINPNKNIIFACAVAENAIGKNAYKPGDVYIGYNKKSVEIGNTDAEGRLVLADSIAYLTKNYKLKRIIDLATLTGSIVYSLGCDHTGLMANNQKLADDLISCGQETDDRVWQMPIYLELQDHIKSVYADIKNIGLSGQAGSISAGEFLRQFVKEGTDWAHLDIAGTAFINDREYWYYNYGATGAGVRLITEYLTKYA